jgi:hypothetical protein
VAGVFELTFYPPGAGREDEFPLRAIYRPPPQEGIAGCPRAKGVFRFDEVLMTKLAATATMPGAYGAALGEAVFGERIQKLFQAALDATRSGESLHVRLALEAKQLQEREIGWERLCGPFPGSRDRRWDFLAIDQRTAFAEYVGSATHQKFPPVGLGQIQVLLVVASPTGADDAPEFDVARTVAAITHPLRDRVTILARVEGAAGPPTLDAMLKRLLEGGITVLHIVAHTTAPSGLKDFCLILEKEVRPAQDKQVADTADRIPGEFLIEKLYRLPASKLPYLTFLSSCDSARPGDAKHGRFANRLARELALPAVIGMADRVSVKTAGEVAELFYASLLKNGHPDLALTAARGALMRNDDVLVPVLVTRIGGRPLFDATVDAVPTNPNVIRRGWGRLSAELKQRAPVLHAALVEKYNDRIPRPDDQDWQANLGELNLWSEEALGVTFNALCQNGEPDPKEYEGHICPFAGAKSIGFDEQRFFKAREALIERLVARLQAHGVLAVVGPSGAGKSSVVLAGVLPKLEMGKSDFIQFTPGVNPCQELTAALGGAATAGTMIVIDQFEELFDPHIAEADRTEFIEKLRGEKAGRWVAITMRSEFRERLRNTWLWEFVSDHDQDVKPMLPAELQQAMVEQAGEVGLRFEDGLVSLIQNDLREEAGRMPLLQHTLRELWRRRSGVWLLAKEYRDLGGVHKALTQTANQFVRDLNEDERLRVTDIFLRLTRLADDAELASQTRRRVQICELIPAGQDEAPTKKLLQSLANEYLVVTADSSAEMAHHALILYWETLGEWIATHRQEGLIRQTLSWAAQEWEHVGKLDNRLKHQGDWLAEALALRGHAVLRLNTLEVDYLAACAARQASEAREREEQHQRTLRQENELASERQARTKAAKRFTWWVLGLSTLAVVLLAVAIKFGGNFAEANRGRQRSLAQSFLQPMGLTEEISRVERDAYRQLAALPADQEKVRHFLFELALADAASAERFWKVAPLAVHAAVQLDAGRRERILEEHQLSRQLQSKDTPLSVRKACAAIGIELSAHLDDRDFAELAAATLCEAVQEVEPFEFHQLVGYLHATADNHGPDAAVRSLLLALKEATRYQGRGELSSESGFESQGLFVDDDVSEADRLDALLTFTERLRAKLSPSDLEKAVLLLWNGEIPPSSPGKPSRIRPKLFAYESFPRRARALARLLSKADSNPGPTLLNRLVEGTRREGDVSIEYLYPLLLLDPKIPLTPENAAQLLSILIDGMDRKPNLFIREHFKGYRYRQNEEAPRDVEVMAQALVQLAERAEPSQRAALNAGVNQAMRKLQGFVVTLAVLIRSGLATDTDDTKEINSLLDAISSRGSEYEPELLLPAWRRLVNGASEEQRAAALAKLLAALEEAEAIDVRFAVLAEMAEGIEASADVAQISRLGAQVIAQGYESHWYAGHPIARALKMNALERSANAVFAKACAVDPESAATTLLTGVASGEGKPNRALMTGILLVSKSPEGRTHFIQGITHEFVSKLVESPEPIMDRSLEEFRSGTERTHFLLRVAHELGVSASDVGLSLSDIEKYVHQISEGLPTHRDSSGHNQYANQLRSLLELLPKEVSSAVLSAVFKALTDDGGVNVHRYALECWPFATIAAPQVNEQIKEAAIRLAVSDVIIHLHSVDQMNDRDRVQIRKTLLDQFESSTSDDNVRAFLSCFRELGIQLSAADVKRMCDRILKLMATAPQVRNQQGLAMALSEIPAPVPEEVLWQAVREPLCPGNARLALLARMPDSETPPADEWSWLKARRNQ